MDLESIRRYCLSFPHAAEDIQWGNDLLFRIGGKIFAAVNLDPSSPSLSFKCTPEKFAELIEKNGIIPAPYVARYHWVSLQTFDALNTTEMKKLIKDSYDMIIAKLPPKVKAKFGVSK